MSPHIKKEHKGEVRITKLVLKRFDMLDNDDAVRDGFKDKEQLLVVLKDIYGTIEGSEWITIYHFTFAPNV